MNFQIRDIEKAVCLRFKLTSTILKSPCRRRDVARPRQIAMYLARELTPASYPQIGRQLGGRDHTTIIYGKRRIVKLLRETNTMAMEVEAVREILLQLPSHRSRIASAVSRGLVSETLGN